MCVFFPWDDDLNVYNMFFCKGKVIFKRMDTMCLLICFFNFASFREIIGKQLDGQTSLTWSDLWVATSEGHPEIEKKTKGNLSTGSFQISLLIQRSDESL